MGLFSEFRRQSPNPLALDKLRCMEKRTATTVGLDIGGANLKAATAQGEAITLPFELWRQPARLPAAITDLLGHWPAVQRVALTMTGELCDCFETKRQGVAEILNAVESACVGKEVHVWCTGGVWLTVSEARHQPIVVAAANWHGLATYVGRFAPTGNALLIDTGSTTTDILRLRDGKPIPTGKNDTERLRSHELIYTGVRRTPVCALLQEGVAAEWFATTADVYLRLGLLPENPEDRSTADGRPSTVAAAHARLARMLGGDGEMTSLEETQQLASNAFARQRQLISEGIAAVTRRESEPTCVIFSGSGEFLARAAWSDFAAKQEQRVEPVMISLTEKLGPDISSAACAYALAVLLEESHA